MLFLLNFMLMQWTSYRIGKCYMVSTNKTIGWCIVGPIWPLTGYPHLPKAKGLLGDGQVRVISLIDAPHDLIPMVDWKVRTV